MTAREPDEIIEAVKTADDLTATVGASARYALGRSLAENTSGIVDAAGKYLDHVDEWGGFTRECFGSLYDKGSLKPLPVDKQSTFGRQAMNALQMQPGFPMLRAAATSHRSIAAEAASELVTAVGGALGLDDVSSDKVESKDPRQTLRALQAMQEALSDTDASDEEIEEATQGLADEHHTATAQRDHLVTTMRTRGRPAIMHAVKRIAQKAQQKAEAVSLLAGMGLDPASEDGDEGIDAALIDLLVGNPSLMEILREMGRLKDSAAAKGMAVAKEGRLDVVGVEPTDNPEALLPDELAMLDDPDLGLYTLARLVEGETLGWDMQADEYRDNGDIVIVVDRSGSMQGATMTFARALAAAVMTNAVAEGRRVVLCMFDHNAEATGPVTKSGGMKKAVQLLGLPASGGTNVPMALRCARGMVEELRDPDVLLITDGAFTNNTELNNAVESFPKDTRFLGLMLNAAWGDHAWLDEKWSVRVNGDASDNDSMVEILSTVGRKNANTSTT